MHTPRPPRDHPAHPERAATPVRAARYDGLDLREIGNAALVRLRSLEDPAEAPLAALELPRLTGRCSGDDPVALCLAPGEWLLVGVQPESASETLANRLQRQLASGLTAVYDHSDGLAGIRVTGAAAPWLLAKLSGIDFAAAGAEWCARTRMGDAAVTVHCRPAGGSARQCEPRFDLYVDRSVAHALWALLEASAPHATELNKEFGAFA
ncbi:MAG: sarcosine oxidase subunit gamma [Lysobacterales bacterium]